mmetsp:Transcript_5071/g.7952  ORF Transcript_5071/g.7952 Transcript_5071/m.7952 type:complete len:119 (+) Transcript_5071:491-847(+)
MVQKDGEKLIVTKETYNKFSESGVANYEDYVSSAPEACAEENLKVTVGNIGNGFREECVLENEEGIEEFPNVELLMTALYDSRECCSPGSQISEQENNSIVELIDDLPIDDPTDPQDL